MRTMADIVCPRHAILARFADEAGRPLCKSCFVEAKAVAEAKALEDKITTLRTVTNTPSLTQSSAAWLLTRLGWGE
jgi:hypothetical protein